VNAAVGRVQIHEQVGIPRVEHGKGPAGFRSVGADVVAVQVPARCILSRADQLGAVLGAPVSGLRSPFLVAVGVVDRFNDQHDRDEHVLVLVEQEVAQQTASRFAFDLAGMDVRLMYATGRPSRRAAAGVVTSGGCDDVRQLASFGGLADDPIEIVAPSAFSESTSPPRRRSATSRRSWCVRHA
jgi:hypothetical protein